MSDLPAVPGLNVEQIAALRAKLDAGALGVGSPREQQLSVMGLNEDQWQSAEEELFSRLADAVDRGEMEDLHLYHDTYASVWKELTGHDLGFELEALAPAESTPRPPTSVSGVEGRADAAARASNPESRSPLPYQVETSDINFAEIARLSMPFQGGTAEVAQVAQQTVGDPLSSSIDETGAISIPNLSEDALPFVEGDGRAAVIHVPVPETVAASPANPSARRRTFTAGNLDDQLLAQQAVPFSHGAQAHRPAHDMPSSQNPQPGARVRRVAVTAGNIDQDLMAQRAVPFEDKAPPPRSGPSAPLAAEATVQPPSAPVVVESPTSTRARPGGRVRRVAFTAGTLDPALIGQQVVPFGNKEPSSDPAQAPDQDPGSVRNPRR